MRKLSGVTDRVRQQHRDWVLEVGLEKLKRAARRLLDGISASSSVVMSGREALGRAGNEWEALSRNMTELPG
jgi:hypothetical protein